MQCVRSTMHVITFAFICCVKAQLEATVEDASNAKRSLDRASSELEAKKMELVDNEKQLKDTWHRLEIKVQECEALKVSA